MNTQAFYKSTKRRISLTPLIDVVFILLLFFMISSNFIKKSAIDVSPVSSSTLNTEQENTALILHEDGLLSVDTRDRQQAKPLELVVNELNTSDKAQQTINLHPVAKTDVQTIVTALAKFKAQNINNISLGRVAQ